MLYLNSCGLLIAEKDGGAAKPFTHLSGKVKPEKNE
jgi:hypothetical protein